MLQAFWDPQVKVANHTSVLQKYFNYKHSFIEPKKIISLMVSVNADLIYTTIPDVETAVKINERSSAFSPICIYIFLWESNHLWDVSVVHIILPKKKKRSTFTICFFKIHSYSKNEPPEQKVGSSTLFCLLLLYALLKTNVLNWLVIVANWL